ncbi:MAG: lipoprotein [Acidimicrobiia bacterium]
MRRLVTALVAAVVVSGCSGATSGGGPASSTTPPLPSTVHNGIVQQPVPLGTRVVAMSIADGAAGFEVTYPLVKATGVGATSLHLPWDKVESVPGVLAPEPDYLSIADSFYPTDHIAVSLSLAVVDTVAARLPPDLADARFDDPAVIDRFELFASWAAAHAQHLEIPVIAVGNEVDVYLAATGRWDEYGAFLDETIPIVHRLFPGIP